jgi:hypothetical protein
MPSKRTAPEELISCPICAGAWVAAGLVYGLRIAPRFTGAPLAIMSAVGIWSGTPRRREQAGDERAASRA